MITVPDRLDPARFCVNSDEPPLPSWASELRVPQAEGIEQILDAYQSGAQTVVVTASTGSGKSLIGEIVRRALDVRAIYLTGTIALQHQIEEAFPYAVVLKGRRNYVPLIVPTHSRYSHLTCADCNKRTEIVDNPEALTDPFADPEVEVRVCDWCPEALGGIKSCSYERVKSRAFGARLVVTNLAYALTEWNGPGRLSGKFPLTILDEADLVAPAITNHVEVTVGPRMMEQLSIDPPTRKTVAAAWPAWFPHAIERLTLESARLAAALPPRSSHTPASLKAHREYTSLVQLLERITVVGSQIEDGGWIYDDGAGVTFRPIRPDGFGREFMFGHGKRFLAMSATPPTADELVSLGAPEPVVSVDVRSSFPVGNRPIRYVPLYDGRESVRTDEWPWLVAGLQRILGAYQGCRGVVHTVSGRLAKYLHTNLHSDRTVLYASAADKDQAMTDFYAREDSILLSGSVGRGIDLIGDAARLNIIARIPHLSMGDRQVIARLYEPGNVEGGKLWYAMETIRTMAQMYGRAVRSADDWGICFVLDKQFGRYDPRRDHHGRYYGTLGHLVPRYFAEAVTRDALWERQQLAGILDRTAPLPPITDLPTRSDRPS